MLKIKYITNVRIPSVRAQSYAIMKMCEQFTVAGAEVELVVPNRKNSDIRVDPFEYHRIEQNFKINRIKSFDLLGPYLAFGWIFYWVDIISFMMMLKLSVKIEEGEILYTRDILIPLFFSKNKKIVLELHDIPQSKFLFRQLIKKPTWFIVISKGLKQELEKAGVPGDKIFVFPSGVDVKELDINIEKTEAKKKLGLDLSKKIVMYIGLLDEWLCLLKVGLIRDRDFEIARPIVADRGYVTAESLRAAETLRVKFQVQMQLLLLHL